ncbi:Auxin efflux carrier component 8 [Vitis vinifera]|uniref:Auxin efflux carrier component 8 n=1 Tax=Vitis vinifera TaxID=29760 RepID=A0A438GHF5_VITVI|nr:Auxin efflux carrier component 8 [Vitis vinifera]
MISLADVYHVVAATIPLYFVMILAYISVKWWKIFTPEQCSGINKGSLTWVITGLSLSTLPNTLILGIPLLKAMYGDKAAGLLSQIVVLQSLVWYNLLLFLFELNAMKAVSATTPLEAAVELEAPQEAQPKEEREEGKTTATRKTKTMLILRIVGRKLMMNPNTHATIVSLIWACIRFRWNVKLPGVVDDSISILSKGGLGMAMFSLGMVKHRSFMASRPSIIACGARLAVLAMGMKFLVGPAIMAASASITLSRGTLFKVSIVQACLPQGIVPFVFAKEYDVHPDILSTGN